MKTYTELHSHLVHFYMHTWTTIACKYAQLDTQSRSPCCVMLSSAGICVWGCFVFTHSCWLCFVLFMPLSVSLWPWRESIHYTGCKSLSPNSNSITWSQMHLQSCFYTHWFMCCTQLEQLSMHTSYICHTTRENMIKRCQ